MTAPPDRRAGEVVAPTREDPVARAASEVVGGPWGDHARPHRWWTPLRVMLAVACIAWVLAIVQKSPCIKDGWNGEDTRYAQLCYSDLAYLYVGRGFAELEVPFTDSEGRYPDLEYPVAHRLPRLRRRGRHPGRPRLAGPDRASRGAGGRRRRAARRRRGAAGLRGGERRAAAAAAAAGHLAARRRPPPPAVGRDGHGRRARAGAHRAGQLGRAAGRLRRRRVLGPRARTAGARRRLRRARRRGQALPRLPARRLPGGRAATPGAAGLRA